MSCHSSSSGLGWLSLEHYISLFLSQILLQEGLQTKSPLNTTTRNFLQLKLSTVTKLIRAGLLWYFFSLFIITQYFALRLNLGIWIYFYDLHTTCTIPIQTKCNQLHSPHGFYLISKLFVQDITSDYGQHGEYGNYLILHLKAYSPVLKNVLFNIRKLNGYSQQLGHIQTGLERITQP